MAAEAQTKFDDEYCKSIISVTENDTVYLYAVGYEASSTNNDQKAFITKRDVNGNLIWKRKVNEASDNRLYSVTSTKEDDTIYLYAIGYENPFNNSIDEAFITKWDTSGNLIWQKRIGGSNNNYFYSITSIVENETIYLYAVGCERLSINNAKAFITKWDSNGNLIWQRKVDETNSNEFYSIIPIIENSVTYLYIIGHEKPSINSNDKAIIIKCDLDGNLIWKKEINETNSNYFYSLTSAKENDTIYLYAVGCEYLSDNNIDKAFITKLDTDGNLIWQRKVNEASDNRFYSVTSTKEDDTVYLYAAGREYPSINNNDEAFITKWDTNGNLIWQRKVNEFSWGYFVSTTFTTESNMIYLYAVGNKWLTTSDNKTDALITKWNTSGNLVYQI